ncbi:MAG: hypothetical protein E7675_00325 [Ruminococcaceae bacterium]|nr:hypothetical protein [Oscillospiraceae bacterium]
MNNYANNVAQKHRAKKSRGKNIVYAAVCIIVFLCFVWLLINPDTVSKLSQKGEAMAVFSVLPSTFPYLVLSGFIIKGGIASAIGKSLSPVSKFYNLPSDSICILFISLISGFPVPSAMAYSLYRQGKLSSKSAEDICGFCSFCGPPFIISLFGARIMKDLSAGIVLFVVQCVLAMILGKILTLSKGSSTAYLSNSLPKEKNSTDPSLDTIICQSISEGGISMLKIISFVIFFSVFSGFIESLLLFLFPDISKIILSIIKGFLEISSGVLGLENLDISEKLKFILGSLYIYWSGISVFFQVSSSTEGFFSMKKYLLGRIFMILLGVPIAYLIYFYILQ